MKMFSRAIGESDLPNSDTTYTAHPSPGIWLGTQVAILAPNPAAVLAVEVWGKSFNADLNGKVLGTRWSKVTTFQLRANGVDSAMVSGGSGGLAPVYKGEAVFTQFGPPPQPIGYTGGICTAVAVVSAGFPNPAYVSADITPTTPSRIPYFGIVDFLDLAQ